MLILVFFSNLYQVNGNVANNNHSNESKVTNSSNGNNSISQPTTNNGIENKNPGKGIHHENQGKTLHEIKSPARSVSASRIRSPFRRRFVFLGAEFLFNLIWLCCVRKTLCFICNNFVQRLTGSLVYRFCIFCNI